eukprot:TRINITY_DN65741_c1_g1_i1.p1 TRINITY_DN65741_c1_g1~~TRINITY_DN65741_c1_g1_i1.p1  ORF type:complete len:442 (+),score=37.64 TRINITY_DN65741_c1_g1_i1:140-1327(+)
MLATSITGSEPEKENGTPPTVTVTVTNEKNEQVNQLSATTKTTQEDAAPDHTQESEPPQAEGCTPTTPADLTTIDSTAKSKSASCNTAAAPTSNGTLLDTVPNTIPPTSPTLTSVSADSSEPELVEAPTPNGNGPTGNTNQVIQHRNRQKSESTNSNSKSETTDSSDDAGYRGYELAEVEIEELNCSGSLIQANAKHRSVSRLPIPTRWFSNPFKLHCLITMLDIASVPAGLGMSPPPPNIRCCVSPAGPVNIMNAFNKNWGFSPVECTIMLNQLPVDAQYSPNFVLDVYHPTYDVVVASHCSPLAQLIGGPKYWPIRGSGEIDEEEGEPTSPKSDGTGSEFVVGCVPPREPFGIVTSELECKSRIDVVEGTSQLIPPVKRKVGFFIASFRLEAR